MYIPKVKILDGVHLNEENFSPKRDRMADIDLSPIQSRK